MKLKQPLTLLLNLIIISLSAQGFNNDSTLLDHKTYYSAEFFEERILNNSMVSFLDNYSDHIVVQNEVIGDFHSPDRQLISIQGNSFRWTKYTLEGQRIDSRLLPGASLYSPNMYNYNLSTDLTEGSINFSKRSQLENNIILHYNVGNMGGITPWTQDFIMHATASERLHLPINYRKHLKGQGKLFMDYTLERKGQELQQQLYLDFGERQLIDVDYTGLASPYNEGYAKAGLMGELATKTQGFFTQKNYAAAYTQREHMNHEFYYNPQETAQSKQFNFSLWGKRNTLSTGINISILNQHHNNTDFTRSYADMDGESLEPYYPDATYYEMTHHYTNTKTLSDKWQIDLSAYNSLIRMQNKDYTASNAIYYKTLVDPYSGEWLDTSAPFYRSLYVKEWQSTPFTSGILENSATTSYHKQLSKHLRFNASFGLSIDGFIVNEKSTIRPNWNFMTHLKWQPESFFNTSLSFGRERIPFHFDMVKYLSPDYLQGATYYWLDNNNDEQFQSNEKGALLHHEGGAYRHKSSTLKQPAYWIVEWPMLFKINKRHHISVYTTYKKFMNMWQMEMRGQDTDYGFYDTSKDPNIFYYKTNQDVHYTIHSEAPEALNVGQDHLFFTSTPFVFTNSVKYVYNGDHLYASASFISHAMVGTNTMGNSVQENNLEFFSDLAANPNAHYKQASRPQQDRGYIAHLLLAYKNKGFNTSFIFKFVDGQPFTHNIVSLNTDTQGQTQIAQRNKDHKGGVAFIDEWGSREDLVVNTELRASYTFNMDDYAIKLNLGVYNLFDFETELQEATYKLPAPNGRIPIELCIPRGLMISTQFLF